jgi:multiple sugar transport system permease protein
MATQSTSLPTVDARPVRRELSVRAREARWGLLFVLPLMLGFLIFQAGPMIASIGISFTDWDILSSPRFAGLDNYVKALTKDPLVGVAFGNTIFMMVVGIPLSMAFSLILAMAMNQKIKGVALLRTIYFLPVVSSLVAISVLWRWLFNADFGLINQLLQTVGIRGPAWLGSEQWAKLALIIVSIWSSLGFNMLLYLSALQNVPVEYHEAAKIDGANMWQRFWFITWPMITPTTFFILTTSIIGAFQTFAQVHLMTRGGGPGAIGGGPRWSTLTVVYYLWLNGFNYYQMGYAAAIAWILGIAIMIFTVAQFLLSQRWVFYNE